MSLWLNNNQVMTVKLHRHIQCIQLDSILSWKAGWWILWNMHNLLYCPWNQAGDPWWKDTNERSHCSRPRVFGVLSNKTLPTFHVTGLTHASRTRAQSGEWLTWEHLPTSQLLWDLFSACGEICCALHPNATSLYRHTHCSWLLISAVVLYMEH